MYLVVMKTRLRIFDELSIPVPMSHLMPETEARRWMLSRGMSASCEVMCEGLFNALNGWGRNKKNETGLLQRD